MAIGSSRLGEKPPDVILPVSLPSASTTNARRRELAIRAAIGAERRQLLQLVVRQAVIAASVGVVAGVITGAAASSVLDATLYEVRARDPLTFAGVAIVLLVVCWIASYLPARRALAANPSDALRAE